MISQRMRELLLEVSKVPGLNNQAEQLLEVQLDLYRQKYTGKIELHAADGYIAIADYVHKKRVKFKKNA